jgi:microfibrillar-associated protein 1
MSSGAFSAKDLALALPDKDVGDSLSLRYINEGGGDAGSEDEFKPTVDKTKKVTIYRAGKVPDWAGEEEEESWVQNLGSKKSKAAEKVLDVRDRRLERLNARDSSPGRVIHEAEIVEEEDDEEEELARRRSRARARARMQDEDDEVGELEEDVAVKPAADEFEEEEEEEAEEDIAERRAAIREKLRKRAAVDEEEMAREEEDEEPGEEGSSSEYETDTDEDEDEGGSRQPLFRPVFVTKEQRDTVAEREEKEMEAEREAEKEKQKLEQRKIETRQMVADEIRRGDEAPKDEDAEAEAAQMPDDNDDVNEAEEYEAWKLRELRRIKEDTEERDESDREKAETERRRNMTDQERTAEDAKMGKNQDKEKAKWKFMQKYHHKGAFYMDDDSIKTVTDVRKREPDGAIGEDKFDKSMLPKVLQVKNFGRIGRTKYTHLVDQDTTDYDAAWGQNSNGRDKYNSKMGGVHGDLNAAGKKRKRDGL